MSLSTCPGPIPSFSADQRGRILAGLVQPLLRSRGAQVTLDVVALDEENPWVSLDLTCPDGLVLTRVLTALPDCLTVQNFEHEVLFTCPWDSFGGEESLNALGAAVYPLSAFSSEIGA